MFSFRKKPLIVEFFIDQPAMYQALAPKEARHFMPSWWKKLEKELIPDGGLLPRPTMKTCQGFIEQYKHGIIIPLWTDYGFGISAAGETQHVAWQTAWDGGEAIEHVKEQWHTFDPNNRLTHLKLINPWAVRCNSDVKWSFSSPSWNLPDTIGDLFFPQGTMSFDVQTSAHLNTMFVHGAKEKKVVLKAGTPVIHLVPLSDRPVEIKLHLVSKAERDAIHAKTTPITSINNFKMIDRAKPKTNSCPFGFGQ